MDQNENLTDIVNELIPRKLNGSSAIVTFARIARPLCVGRVTIVALRTDLFFEAQAPSVGSIRCSGPSTTSFV